jgi:hypothetical protein
MLRLRRFSGTRSVLSTKVAGRPVAILLLSAAAFGRGRRRTRPPGNDSQRLQHPAKSTYFDIGLRSFLEDLRAGRSVEAASCACSAPIAFLGAARSPRSVFLAVSGREAVSQTPPTEDPIRRRLSKLTFIGLDGGRAAWIGLARMAFPLWPPASADRTRRRFWRPVLRQGAPHEGLVGCGVAPRPGSPISYCAPALPRENASTEWRIPGILDQRSAGHLGRARGCHRARDPVHGIDSTEKGHHPRRIKASLTAHPRSSLPEYWLARCLIANGHVRRFDLFSAGR